MAATSRYLLPPILKITRPFFRMSALRNISLTSVGFDQSAPRTMWTQALRGCSASSRPGLFQNVRNVLTAIIRIAQHTLFSLWDQGAPDWERGDPATARGISGHGTSRRSARDCPGRRVRSEER